MALAGKWYVSNPQHPPYWSNFALMAIALSPDMKKLYKYFQFLQALRPHWGRVTHICVGKLTIIGSDNGLSPDRRQAIIWTNARILLIGPLGTNFSESLIELMTFSFTKMRLKVSSAKWRPFCLGLNVLNSRSKSLPVALRNGGQNWWDTLIPRQ